MRPEPSIRFCAQGKSLLLPLAQGTCSDSRSRKAMPRDRGLNSGEKTNIPAVFQKGSKKERENCRPVSLTSMPRKVSGQLLLDVISKPVWNNRKGNSCLSNLIATCVAVTGWFFSGESSGCGQLALHEAFDSASHNMLLRQVCESGLEKWAVGLQTQRAVTSGGRAVAGLVCLIPQGPGMRNAALSLHVC